MLEVKIFYPCKPEGVGLVAVSSANWLDAFIGSLSLSSLVPEIPQCSNMSATSLRVVGRNCFPALDRRSGLALPALLGLPRRFDFLPLLCSGYFLPGHS